MPTALEIKQIPVMTDNYIYVIRDAGSGRTGVVDPALAGPVIDYLESEELALHYILNTHHHADHVGANRELKETYGCQVIGPAADQDRIPGIDVCVGEGDSFAFGNLTVKVFDTPGHTRGHIVFYFSSEEALFCGDTLFAMGCGRLFEGTPQQMWHSLRKIRQLPPKTWVYCAHEYTEANGNFALTIEPSNTALQARMEQVKQLRAQNHPTVPSLLAEEMATNPFLRADKPDLRRELNMTNTDPVDVFAEIRQRKDKY
mgnify:FL=1